MPEPVDPSVGPRFGLHGRVVSMDDSRTILDDGVVYVDQGNIVAVQHQDDAVPPGFDSAAIVRTGDTLFPGLIELHNHLSYNVLPLWDVPKKYSNNSQWGRHSDYRKLVSGPMKVLGKSPGYPEAIVRYVEAKCLLGGVTTSQGIALYSNSGIRRMYRGLVRNVEQTGEDALPGAATRIANVDAEDAQKFLANLERRKGILLLHLSEGVDEAARRHFLALQIDAGRWAISDALCGIHSAALQPTDFEIMVARGAGMVWSPLSNLLLYGGTANIEAAKTAGMLMGLGSDWSPSGSKNLLGELKVARLVSEHLGGIFSDAEIAAMVTCNAARILKWDGALGALQAGKRADILAINGRQGDPYAQLVEARETSVTLVLINGIARYGQPRLMRAFGPSTEEFTIGRSRRLLNFSQATSDPIVGSLSLQAATDRLRDGLAHLPELARTLENPPAGFVGGSVDPTTGEVWFIASDHEDVQGESQRHHLPLAGVATGPGEFAEAAAAPLSEVVARIVLDPITVADDRNYFRRIAMERNLPEFIKRGLAPLYGQEPPNPGEEIVGEIPEPSQEEVAYITDLRTLLRTPGELTKADRLRIVDQARVLFEQNYVHLPLKRAMHAVDPVQRLKLLHYRLEETPEEQLRPEIEFHREVSEIFNGARDLHTSYTLPDPFRNKIAYLPFIIEEYADGGAARYLVTKVLATTLPATFKPGVEVLYWNGTPIARAIARNADSLAGSNQAARHARGLDALTIRPLARVPAPDEEWVTLRCVGQGGEALEFTQPWRVLEPRQGFLDLGVEELLSKATTSLGIDAETDAIHEVKKALYAPNAVRERKAIDRGDKARAAVAAESLETALPDVLMAREVRGSNGEGFGYVRIFTFKVAEADGFVDEFARLAESLSRRGLILDVRGNGGGSIHAAERLLQVLTPHPVEPERAQFINSPLNLAICRRHRDAEVAGPDLGPWVESIERSVETGATYSLGYPITEPASCRRIGQRYQGPVLLITDALCYSATDMFAAGFQDHDMGPVLGVDPNTGAGGANVWTHGQLRQLAASEESPYQALPGRAGMTVAIRRMLRVGEQAGTPLEDLGVQPDERHEMTREDLLQGNRDLIAHATRLLAQRTEYRLDAASETVADGQVQISVETANLTRIDVFVDGRPVHFEEIIQPATTFALGLPASQRKEQSEVELRGFDTRGKLVTARRIQVRWYR